MLEFNDLTISHKRGVILAQYDYYAYGLMWSDPNRDDIYNKTAQSQEWNQNEFGDTGMDLYRFEARMYDPVIARWTSLDPAQQFFNNYIAMANNPANFVDPDGRWSWDCLVEKLGGAINSDGGSFLGGFGAFASMANSVKSLSAVSDAAAAIRFLLLYPMHWHL
jgi:RHS repeat-associated protein